MNSKLNHNSAKILGDWQEITDILTDLQISDDMVTLHFLKEGFLQVSLQSIDAANLQEHTGSIISILKTDQGNYKHSIKQNQKGACY